MAGSGSCRSGLRSGALTTISGGCLVSRSTFVAVLSVPLLALGALAGCGIASDSSSSRESSAKSDVLAKLASDVKGSLQKTADTTAEATSVTLSFTGTSAGEKVSGTGVVSFRPSKIEMTVDAGTTSTTVRIVGGVIYVQVPPDQRANLDGKSWMRLDAGAAAGGAGANRQYEDVDPVKQIKTLLAGDDVSVVGQEKVNGVQTVHYRAKVSLAAYLGQVDPKGRAAAQKELAKAGVDAIDLDVWVDEQYRPRRMHMVMGTTTDMTMDYTDYGKPVRIEAPPAKDTVDFDDLLGR